MITAVLAAGALAAAGTFSTDDPTRAELEGTAGPPDPALVAKPMAVTVTMTTHIGMVATPNSFLAAGGSAPLVVFRSSAGVSSDKTVPMDSGGAEGAPSLFFAPAGMSGASTRVSSGSGAAASIAGGSALQTFAMPTAGDPLALDAFSPSGGFLGLFTPTGAFLGLIGPGGLLIGDGVLPGQNGGLLFGNGADGAPGQNGGNAGLFGTGGNGGSFGTDDSGNGGNGGNG